MILKADDIEHIHWNLTPEVILKENFYTSQKRRSRACYFRRISCLVISLCLKSRLYKSLTWTSLSWRCHHIWTVFHLETCWRSLKLPSAELGKSWCFQGDLRDSSYLWDSCLQLWLLSSFLKAISKCTVPLSWMCPWVLCSLAGGADLRFTGISFANFSGMV